MLATRVFQYLVSTPTHGRTNIDSTRKGHLARRHSQAPTHDYTEHTAGRGDTQAGRREGRQRVPTLPSALPSALAGSECCGNMGQRAARTASDHCLHGRRPRAEIHTRSITFQVVIGGLLRKSKLLRGARAPCSNRLHVDVLDVVLPYLRAHFCASGCKRTRRASVTACKHACFGAGPTSDCTFMRTKA